MAVHLLTAILFVVCLTVACCALTIWQRPTLPADRENNNKKLKIEAHFRRQVLRENMLATEINKLERELRRKSQTLRHFRHFRQMSSPKGSKPSREKRDIASQDDDTPVPIPKFYKYLIRRCDGRCISPCPIAPTAIPVNMLVLNRYPPHIDGVQFSNLHHPLPL
eukprot:jgi/Bigna1/68939/fgenesh1_pg.7_\